MIELGATTVISLSFSNDQYAKIKQCAVNDGVAVAAYMRQAVLDRMQDEEDYRAAQANRQASAGETVSRAEIMNRLNMKC